jgi:hypothetical protein
MVAASFGLALVRMREVLGPVGECLVDWMRLGKTGTDGAITGLYTR